jgi:hypothetical protein
MKRNGSKIRACLFLSCFWVIISVNAFSAVDEQKVQQCINDFTANQSEVSKYENQEAFLYFETEDIDYKEAAEAFARTNIEYLKLFVPKYKLNREDAVSVSKKLFDILKNRDKSEESYQNPEMTEWYKARMAVYDDAQKIVEKSIDDLFSSQAVSQTDTQTQTNSASGLYEINAETLNVRANPNMSGKTLWQLKKGQTVEVTGIKDGWANIVFEDTIKKQTLNGYIKAEYITKTENGQNTVQQVSNDDSAIGGLLIFFSPFVLILFIWLTKKARKRKIIVYKNWVDAFLTAAAGILAFYTGYKINLPAGIALIILSFVWSCWISIVRNKRKGRGFFVGFIIGIARMLIVYLLIVLFLIAWAAIISQKGSMEKAMRIKGKTAKEINEKRDKIIASQSAGIIASIAFSILAWLMVSFIHNGEEL